jgi:hypothetical protein
MTTDNSVTISNVLVFKTNILSDADIITVAQMLAPEDKIFRWNVDRADIDNVLRIEDCEIESGYIVDLFCAAGFQCEELPD